MKRKVICLLMFLGLSVVPVLGLTIIDSPDVTILDSDISYGWVKVYGSSEVVFNRGKISLLYMNDQSHFHMNGGTLNSFPDVSYRTYDESKIFQYGGSISMFTLLDNSEGYFYGGDLEYLRVYSNDAKAYVYSEVKMIISGGTGEVHLYGYAYEYTESKLPTSEYDLSYSNLRIYRDSSLMDYYDIALADFYITDPIPWEFRSFDSVVFHQIPEPATLVLLGLGGLLIRKRKL